MRAICAVVLGTIFCSPALAQDIAGSTTIQIDPNSGTVTATCETDLNSADDGYYAARVTCVVHDQNGNLLASGAYSDDGDRNGYALVTLTFVGDTSMTYTAMGAHSAAVTVPFDAPLGQPQGLYYDEYNFEPYVESPQTYNDGYDWYGPGPEEQTRLKSLHIGNTTVTLPPLATCTCSSPSGPDSTGKCSYSCACGPKAGIVTYSDIQGYYSWYMAKQTSCQGMAPNSCPAVVQTYQINIGPVQISEFGKCIQINPN